MNKQQPITPEKIEATTSDIYRIQPKLPAPSEMLHLLERVAAYVRDAQTRGLSSEEIDEELRKAGYPVKTKTKRSVASGARHRRRRASATTSHSEAPLERLSSQAPEKTKRSKIA